jgi:hypothetical protein
VVASAGSFAAIRTLLGSPIVGAFFLMGASGPGGQMLGLGAAASIAGRGGGLAHLHRPGRLFSGQAALALLAQHAATYTVWALLLLVLCKGLACAISLGSFRGGRPDRLVPPARWRGGAAVWPGQQALGNNLQHNFEEGPR